MNARWKSTRVNSPRSFWSRLGSNVKIEKKYDLTRLTALFCIYEDDDEIVVAIYRGISDRVRWAWNDAGRLSANCFLIGRSSRNEIVTLSEIEGMPIIPRRFYIRFLRGPDVWGICMLPLQCAQPCVRNNGAWNIKGSKFAYSWLPRYESAPMFHKFVPV